MIWIIARKKENVCLNDLMNGISNLFPDDFIHFTAPSTPITVKIDRTQIEQVLINLIKNAIEACDGRSNPSIGIKASGAGKGAATIEVSDNGPGILPDVLDKIFIPFFTTKEKGSGI